MSSFQNLYVFHSFIRIKCAEREPIFYFNCEHFLFVYIVKQKQTKNFLDFQKSNFEGNKIIKFSSSINFSWKHMRYHKKFGPDRFSRFDIYSIQTNKQYLYKLLLFIFIFKFVRDWHRDLICAPFK